MMLKDVSRRRSPPSGFNCGERIITSEDGVKSVVFHCNLRFPSDESTPASTNTALLKFHCREPSCGALVQGEEAVTFSDEDYAVDPNFFDEGYSLAGMTGFKVWTGSRFLIEALAWPSSEVDCQRLMEIQNLLSNGARVIELGAGIGTVGTYLAAVGAQVLLTDLPTLVENAIDCNLSINAKITAADHNVCTYENDEIPSWMESHGCRIFNGWAASAALDWSVAVSDQLTKLQSESIDLIVASDVVFLVDMLNSLLDTVAVLFESSSNNNPSFVLSFQRRDAGDGEESASFTTVNRIVSIVKGRGWKLDCLAWRSVIVNKEKDGKVFQDESEVFLFEISP